MFESIVTSSPRGVRPGRSGFQTVLQTQGINTTLVEALERASAYSHLYPPGDSRNPQIRRHAIVRTPGGTFCTLSRIVDAGDDYTGRSNTLAHHFTLDHAEVLSRMKSSPAALLQHLERIGAFQGIWQGDPYERANSTSVPILPVEPEACSGWQRVALDAGWAGLIADRALARLPTWIVVPPSEDLLPLFAEASALVNYPQRWGITFSTCAAEFEDVLWRGAVDGSPQAEYARSQSQVAVVDLQNLTTLAVESPLIAAARGLADVPWKPGIKVVSCDHFSYACHRKWSDLSETTSSAIRHCLTCQQDVHLCNSVPELQRHADAGHCVANDVGKPLRSGRRWWQFWKGKSRSAIFFRRNTIVVGMPLPTSPPHLDSADLKSLGDLFREPPDAMDSR